VSLVCGNINYTPWSLCSLFFFYHRCSCYCNLPTAPAKRVFVYTNTLLAYL